MREKKIELSRYLRSSKRLVQSGREVATYRSLISDFVEKNSNLTAVETGIIVTLTQSVTRLRHTSTVFSPLTSTKCTLGYGR